MIRQSHYVTMTDQELAREVMRGNQNACTFLVLKYQKLVFHIVRRSMNPSQPVEDICQDVFLKVLRNISGWRGDSKLSTWIATIAYNTAMSHVKREQIKKAVLKEGDAERTLRDQESVAAAKGLESGEVRDLLLMSIDALPVNYRTVLTLFYLEEFSYREIEAITGMPEGTIKSYLFRAKFLLRGKLEKIERNEKASIFTDING